LGRAAVGPPDVPPELPAAGAAVRASPPGPPFAGVPPHPPPTPGGAGLPNRGGDGEDDGEALSLALAAIDDPPLLRSDDAVLFHALVYASSASLDALTRVGRSIHGELVRRAGRRWSGGAPAAG